MGYHFREQESYVRILELTPELRKEIEKTVEALIALLDRWDGDENLEETGDEHDIATPANWQKSYLYVGDDSDDRPFTALSEDDEDGHDTEEDHSDDEPDLGRPDHRPDQSSFAGLGSGGEEFSASGNAGIWGWGDSHNDDDEDGHDREFDIADYGFGDADALQDESLTLHENICKGWTGSGTAIAERLLTEVTVRREP